MKTHRAAQHAGTEGGMPPTESRRMRSESISFPMRAWLSGLLFLSVILSGCNRRNHPVYAVIPKGTAVIHWQTMHAGAVAAAREANVEIKYNGPAMEADFAKQIAILDDFVNQRVDGILL